MCGCCIGFSGPRPRSRSRRPMGGAVARRTVIQLRVARLHVREWRAAAISVGLSRLSASATGVSNDPPQHDDAERNSEQPSDDVTHASSGAAVPHDWRRGKKSAFPRGTRRHANRQSNQSHCAAKSSIAALAALPHLAEYARLVAGITTVAASVARVTLWISDERSPVSCWGRGGAAEATRGGWGGGIQGGRDTAGAGGWVGGGYLR